MQFSTLILTALAAVAVNALTNDEFAAAGLMTPALAAEAADSKLDRRSYYGYNKGKVDACERELRRNRAQKFCVQYLGYDYSKERIPVTTTKTATKTTTKAGNTVTNTETFWTSTTTTEVTEVTDISTTTVATVTETLPMSEATPVVENPAPPIQRAARRSYYAPSVPKYLRNRYSSSDISTACRRIVRKPYTRRTVTATRTATRTATGPSVTHTASTTISVTVTESTTTTTSTTALATETVKVSHACDQPVVSHVVAAGILNAPSTAYTWTGNSNQRDCCMSCWQSGSGCNGWFLFETDPSLGTFQCGQIFNYAGPTDTISETCPSGLSDFWLVRDASNERPQNVGGLGPCGDQAHLEF